MRMIETGRLKWLFGRHDANSATDEVLNATGPLAREVLAYTEGVTMRARATVTNLSFVYERISYLMTPGVPSQVRSDFPTEETKRVFDPVAMLQKHGMYYHKGEFRMPVGFSRIPQKNNDSFHSIAIALTELLALAHPQQFIRLHELPEISRAVRIDSVRYTKKTSFILENQHDFALRADISVLNVPAFPTQPIGWDTPVGTLQFVIVDRQNR